MIYTGYLTGLSRWADVRYGRCGVTCAAGLSATLQQEDIDARLCSTPRARLGADLVHRR